MGRTCFFVCAVAFVLRAGAAQAQQRAPSEAATAELRLVENIGVERLPNGVPTNLQNAATLLQNGAGNISRIDQQSLSGVSNQTYVVQVGAANVLGLVQVGGGNVATMKQNGTDNHADFTQNGQGNVSTLTQKGASNRLTGLVVGNGNELNIHQDGNGNRVDSEIHQNKQSYTINQYGTGNVLKQVESTIQAIPGYTVEMRGSGINLTIEQGKVK